MQYDFQPGDKVVCVNALYLVHPDDVPAIEKGKVYTVDVADRMSVYLKGMRFGWHKDRFELYRDEKTIIEEFISTGKSSEAFFNLIRYD